ncbi:MAG: reverse transcriptase domain-containing protein [Pseudomonas sp.]
MAQQMQNGEVSRAFRTLTQVEGMAAADEATRERLEAKHPRRAEAHEVTAQVEGFRLDADQEEQLTEQELLAALWKAPRGSAPGADDWRFEHLWDVLRVTSSAVDPASTRLTDALLALVNQAQHGRLPRWCYTLLAGANLVALRKGLADVRPIAMGNMFRKLVSRCLLVHHQPLLDAHFMPTQFGVGARNGAETIVHATSTLMDAHPDWVFFQTDFANAYNSILRCKSLEAVREHFPSLLPWLRAIYSPRSALWFDPHDDRQAMTSEEGAQQGDPLGPLLFCASMHSVLEQANATLTAHGGGLALGYIDDIVGCGPEAAVRECFATIEAAAQECGLQLQLHKCSAYRPSGDVITQLPGAVGVEDEGLVVLGVPLGRAEFVQQKLVERVEGLTAAEEAIAGLGDSQQAMVLLRMCYAQKLSYHLRTVDSDLIAQASIRFDESVERCFRSIIGIRARLSSQQWQQVSLDTKHGGFGLSSCAKSRRIAYLASVGGVSPTSDKSSPVLSLEWNSPTSRRASSQSHSASEINISVCEQCRRSVRRSVRWCNAPSGCSIVSTSC